MTIDHWQLTIGNFGKILDVDCWETAVSAFIRTRNKRHWRLAVWRPKWRSGAAERPSTAIEKTAPEQGGGFQPILRLDIIPCCGLVFLSVGLWPSLLTVPLPFFGVAPFFLPSINL
ncbi:MAG: hypothetical protein GY943_19500 [Chloroflexi bacterium]|nr:hypothetical protein [Chloroflexota bacterium]